MYCFFNYALQRNTLIYNAGIDFRPVIVKVGFLSREFFRCESGESKTNALIKHKKQEPHLGIFSVIPGTFFTKMLKTSVKYKNLSYEKEQKPANQQNALVQIINVI